MVRDLTVGSLWSVCSLDVEFSELGWGLFTVFRWFKEFVVRHLLCLETRFGKVFQIVNRLIPVLKSLFYSEIERTSLYVPFVFHNLEVCFFKNSFVE